MKALYVKREAEGRATADVAQAARAATFGAIDTLLFDMDASEAGTISEEDGSVTFGKPGPGTYGIVDEIAGRALATGAKVMAVRKPDLPAGDAALGHPALPDLNSPAHHPCPVTPAKAGAHGWA